MKNQKDIELAKQRVMEMFGGAGAISDLSVVLSLRCGAYLFRDSGDYFFVADKYEACSIDHEMDKCSSYRRVKWEKNQFVAI